MLKRELCSDDDKPLSFKRTRSQTEAATDANALPPPRQRLFRACSPPAKKTRSASLDDNDDDEFTRDIRIECKLHHVWPKQSNMGQYSINELPDPGDVYPAVPGSIRWLIRGTPPTEATVLAAAKISLVRQLVLHDPEVITAKNVTINFPPFIERQWYVEAIFATVDGYIAGRTASLKWSKQELKLTRAAAPIGPRKVMLKFTQLRSSTDMNDFLNFLRKALASAVTLTDLWIEYSTCSWKNPAKQSTDTKPQTLPPRMFTGTVSILAEYKEGYGPDQVPGFLRYDELDQRIDFYGRGERCHYCKNSPTREAHSYRECTWKTCPHCGGRGHLEDSCRERYSASRPLRPRTSY